MAARIAVLALAAAESWPVVALYGSSAAIAMPRLNIGKHQLGRPGMLRVGDPALLAC